MIRSFIIAVTLSVLSLTISAQTAKPEQQQEQSTLQQHLETPAVPEKMHQTLVAYMRREAESLHKLGYRVETMRKGEIVIATIPTDRIFLPNSTTIIKSSADKLLKPFVNYLRTPGRYKLLITVHTDNTGKPQYTFNLSEERVMALYDWFDNQAGESQSLFGFPLGDTTPLVDNNTRKNRAKNRRIEIYIVPDQELINSLKNKKTATIKK